METKKTLKVENSDFKRIIENNYYFVDKSALIYEFFTSSSYISLMPRPKRFGKTLNLSMLEYFFDITKKESSKLFLELEISDNKQFCEAHQNKYPVINISLKDIKETNWENCLESFKNTIQKIYENNIFLLKSTKLDSYSKKTFKSIILNEAKLIDYKLSLKNLCQYLKQHFEKDVIILVDEYDAPIINAFKNTQKPIKNTKGKITYYEEVINFMQTFLGSAFKGNNDLQQGLITGVMRIGRESIFSEWNNFSVYGITSTYFADKFGFTKSETIKMLNYFGLENKIEDVEKWYDGYKFGNIEKIYNPWSIVNYIANVNDGFKAYWVNTSDDSIIKERINETGVNEVIQELLSQKTIIKTIKDNFIFSDFEGDNELLWTLLFYSGFLTQVKEISLNRYELKIPNYELKYVFETLILDWIKTKYKFSQDLLITTTNYLITNKIKDFEKGFKKIMNDSISYFDISQKKDKTNKELITSQEQIYHVYTLGLLAILSDDYIIKSNRESGDGRYDIVLIPRNLKNNGVVIEIKKTKQIAKNENIKLFKKRINNEIENALQQIELKKYYNELILHNIELEKIIRLPIIFAGKEPFITKFTDKEIENEN